MKRTRPPSARIVERTLKKSSSKENASIIHFDVSEKDLERFESCDGRGWAVKTTGT